MCDKFHKGWRRGESSEDKGAKSVEGAGNQEEVQQESKGAEPQTKVQSTPQEQPQLGVISSGFEKSSISV